MTEMRRAGMCKAIKLDAPVEKIAAVWPQGASASRASASRPSNFYWVDDAHGDDALAFLASHGRADRAIEANVDRDPDALLETMHRLA